jgi:alpha-mannosidase
VTQEITLYNDLKRVDFSARILRDSTPMVEVYFAFPFQVDAPQFRFEAANAVTEPTRDQWPGSNTDYYAVQHWADVFDDEGGIVWTAVDTPMAEFGGLWPGYMSGAHHGVRGPGYGHPFLRPGELERGHIYSLVSYNNFRTNFINVHPGEFLVRYSFGSHEGDWRDARASQFGWNAANPPLPVWMKGPRPGGSLPTTASFCQVDVSNVLVLTLKAAEDGNGYILRLVETEGKATKAKVTLPHLRLLHAFETNLVEENERMALVDGHTVETTIKPFGLATLRLAAEL